MNQTAEVIVSNAYNAKNRIDAWDSPACYNSANCYDETGNLKAIPATGGSVVRTANYDAENRMTSATVNGQTTTYTYDGDGRRVMKHPSSGPDTVFVYDPFGNLAQEYGPATDSGTKYITADHLGSTRLVTDSAGAVDKCYDYLPFGEEIANGTASRTSTCFGGSQYPSSPDKISNKFTSKERDAETGLDYFGARYMSSAQGRFTSADPKQFPHDITDPQSWNKYSYTRNNPLRYTDPDGEDWKDALSGALNAFGSDNLFGAGRATGGNSDFRSGQAIGDAVATLQGTVETLAGIGGEIGGTALDLTGIGALIGVPVQVVSAGAIVQGSSAAVFGARGLGNAVMSSMQDNAPTSSGKPYESNPQNQERMSQGKAPVGKDGKPVELHHEGQASQGNLKEMTQGEHRGGDNFKKNHPNTGQEPSQIDRSKFRQQREQYWKDKAKKPEDQ